MKTVNANIKDFTRSELKEFLIQHKYDSYRADQIFNWIYNHLISDFSTMVNISKELRNELSSKFEIDSLKLSDTQESTSHGTRKYLLETSDNHKVESVFIPGPKRNTLCLSTQSGCPLDCKFCATGLMGFKRNLSSSEILDQYLFAARDIGKSNLTNVVFMGMGEPLLNFKTLIRVLNILTDDLYKGLSKHRITVSTSGIAPKIVELAESKFNVKLAFSLHSCFEDIRSEIMPINNKYSLEQNIKALKSYAEKTDTRITFEYTMLSGINDRREDIKALTKLCAQLPSKINLIPFNSIAHMSPAGLSSQLKPTNSNDISKFADALRKKNITVMLRDTRGDDIAAACGQLAAK